MSYSRQCVCVQRRVKLLKVFSAPTLSAFRICSSVTQTMTVETTAMKECVPTVRTETHPFYSVGFTVNTLRLYCFAYYVGYQHSLNGSPKNFKFGMC